MKNKYFTPDIEDVRIGMEYYYLRDNNEFILFKLTEKDFRAPEWIESLTGRKQSIFTYLQEGKIKVAYLTKEQIEAEGWTKEKSYFIKNNIYLFFEDKFLVIDSGNPFSWEAIDSEILFKGKCKDINTFRKICKLLEI